jgi:hypothetical protein
MTTLAASLPTTAASYATLAAATTTPSRKALWAGRALTTLGALFLGFDATLKLLQLPVAVAGTAKLGYPISVVFGLGVVQAILLGAYLLPRTAVLGALLWTGYLGGAVATHVRVGDPVGSHILFPIYVAIVLWAGLWLRWPEVRALFRRR